MFHYLYLANMTQIPNYFIFRLLVAFSNVYKGKKIDRKKVLW